MRNKEIKDYIKSKNISMWRVAERLGISDSSFSRMLRYEITAEKRQKYMKLLMNWQSKAVYKIWKKQ